jgi:hypothetical protein
MGGVVSCIISLICHIPLGMAGIKGVTLYNKVRNLGDIYDVIPHGARFLDGLAYVAYTVRTLDPLSRIF